MKKPGCGPLAAIVVILVVVLFIAANEGVGFYFSHCDDEEFEGFFDCIEETLASLGEDEAEPEEGSVTAVGTYTYKDYDVNITAHIPLRGGNVTGSVSGSCDGAVKGNYVAATGVISGKMNGTCSPFVVKIPASAEYTGSVNKGSKSVPIQFTGRGAGITHDGSVTLVWSDEKKEGQ